MERSKNGDAMERRKNGSEYSPQRELDALRHHDECVQDGESRRSTRSERVFALQTHFEESMADVQSLFHKIETLPQGEHQEFDHYKSRHEELKADQNNLDQLAKEATTHPSSYFKFLGRSTRDANETKLYEIAVKARRLYRDMNVEYKRVGDRNKDTKIKELKRILQSRDEILKMEVPEMRSEWEKRIDTYPIEYKASQTRAMNETLIPREKRYMVKEAEKLEFLERRPMFQAWIDKLPQPYRKEETEQLHNQLIPSERQHLLQKLNGMDPSERRQAWNAWLGTLPDNFKQKEMEDPDSYRVVNEPPPGMYA